jgi:hypothetical protein
MTLSETEVSKLPVKNGRARTNMRTTMIEEKAHNQEMTKRVWMMYELCGTWNICAGKFVSCPTE